MQTKTPDAVELPARLRLAIARMARRMRQEAGDELSPSMMAALATIENRGPLTPSELAEFERIKRPTATRVLRRLEEDGLIVRTADPSDGRSAVVSVTRDGAALLKKLRSRKNAYLARRLRELPDEDVEALERAAEVLERLLDEERR
ncbi:MAG: MarR family winged helix-turn-helix transcriptional regulator [Thermoleophilaceae bacterium]